MTSPEVQRTDGNSTLPPTSPEEWLRLLTRRMDLRRRGVLTLRSYVDGNAPLPEMSRETAEAWRMFQRRARTNWGELIVESVVDRLVPNGITVAGENDSPIAEAAQRIWRNNRMNSVFKSWLRYGLTFGQSYLTVWTGQDGETVITADSPETMVVISDPLQPWKPVAAMRVWRNEQEARDYAIVWTSSGWQQFTRPTYSKIELKVIPSKWLVNLAEGAWTQEGQPSGRSELGVAQPIPVVVYNNPGGHGDFETHLDLINRINAGILERLCIAAVQAFRQRAITGGLLPERDPDGNMIDYTKVFAPAPGVLWNLPAGLDLWESTPVDLGGILNATKEDVRQLSAVTRTPLPMLMPDHANTSAEGARETSSGHYFRCVDRLDEARNGIEKCIEMAVMLNDSSLSLEDVEPIEISFEPVDRVTTAEKYQAALAAHNSGESWKSIQRNILGYSPDQIAQDEIDRIQESMIAQTMVPRVGGQQQRGPAPVGQQPQPRMLNAAGESMPTTMGGLQPGGE
jgi:hypothetical protein